MDRIKDFSEFYDLLMIKAPKDYQPWFFPCKPKSKNPSADAILKIDPSSKGSWEHPSARLTKEQCIKHLEQGYNIGISARENDPLIIGDIDSPEYLNQIPANTLTVTSRKRVGAHFFGFDKDKSAKQNITTDDGELRSSNQYVLACGSYVPFNLDSEKDKKAFDSLTEEAKKDSLIGYYTLRDRVSPRELSFEDLPDLYKNQQKQDTLKEAVVKQREEVKSYQGEGKYTDLFNLRVSDIVGIPKSKRESHPLHDSDTCSNFSVSEDGTLAHCWRHLVSLNAVQYLCVQAGYCSCGDAGTPHKGRGLSKIKGDKKALEVAYNEAVKVGLIKQKAQLTYAERIYNSQFETPINNKAYDYKKELILWQYNDFAKLKEDKTFIVKRVFYPKTIVMLYSPPGEFKSILALDMALSISTGQDWLNFETKKQAVLYCDKENNDQIIKQRLQGLKIGKNYKRNKFPLFILRRHGDLLDSDFVEQLFKTVEKNEIKVVFFDTLHRFADYDENSSDDLNRIYTQVFQPLVEQFGCSVCYLHHSKKDGGYRGTGDFLGMVDTAYSVQREKASNKKTNKFTILNEKSRSGEIETIKGEIDFSEDDSYIKIIRLNEAQEETKEIDKLKFVTNKIKEFCPDGKKMKRKDFETALTMANIDFSIPTLKRSLRFLVENAIFDYDSKKFEYWKVLR